MLLLIHKNGYIDIYSQKNIYNGEMGCLHSFVFGLSVTEPLSGGRKFS